MGRSICDAGCVWAVFVGSVIGAGFASGEEVLAFFAVYGTESLAATAAAGALFALLGARLILLAHRAGGAGQEAVLRLLFGRFARWASALLALLWLAVLAVMLSGAGALFQMVSLPSAAGSLLLAALLYVLSLCGTRAVLGANVIVTPLVLGAMCAATVWSLVYHQADSAMLFASTSAPSLSLPALTSSLFYVSYNLAMCVPALISLPVMHKGAVCAGASLAGLTLSLMLASLLVVVLLHYEAAVRSPIPMLMVASMQHDACFWGYAAVLSLAMVTSALGALVGVSRFCAVRLPRTRVRNLLILSAAVLVSQAGLGVLVETVLPVMGYVSLVFMIRLCLPVREGILPR